MQARGALYPCLTVRLRVGDETRDLEALVDAGLDGDMIVPSGTVFAEPSIGACTFAWANEALAEDPAYLGTVQLGGFDPVPRRSRSWARRPSSAGAS